MKIVVDENVAFAEDAFAQFGEVKLLHGRKITHEHLKDVDALIVRSITKINQELLKDTRVRFVGTATIGTDHVDKKSLQEKEIGFADAKGCNADAVAEYIFTALFTTAAKQNISLKDKTIGIVGVGNIGSRIARYAEAYGMKVLLNDPPRARVESNSSFVSLEKILSADIITQHVPLTRKGEDSTFHLLNDRNLALIKEGTVFINASRGEVLDTEALKPLLEKRKFTAVLDVWENEPEIDQELVNRVLFATPHVAGYSLEGKVNGTRMMVEALNKHFNLKVKWTPEMPTIENSIIEIPSALKSEQALSHLFNIIYNIEADSRPLKTYSGNKMGSFFDLLRKEYPLRREFSNYSVKAEQLSASEKAFLKALRFSFV